MILSTEDVPRRRLHHMPNDMSDAAGPITRSLVGRRVLIYGMNYSPEAAATGRYTGDIGAELARRGASVHVVTTPPHYPGWRVANPYKLRYCHETLDGVSVTRCPLYLSRSVRGLTRLLAALSFAVASLPIVLWKQVRHRPHVILCIEPTLIPAPVAVAMARLLGTRTVLHVQDLEVDAAFEVGHLNGRTLRKIAYFFERITVKSFDKIITISEAMKNRIIGKGVRSSSISVVRNWVDLTAIFPKPKSVQYRNRLGIPPDAFVVLYSGSMGAKQGLEALGEAAEKLQNTSTYFILCGEGPERKRLSTRFGMLPNLAFLDFRPQEELGEFLSMVDLHIIPQLPNATDFALPSKLGGILASGRPVLAMANSNQELAVFLAGAAAVIPAGDSDLLATTILRLSREEDGQFDARAKLARELAKETALDRIVSIIME